VPDKPRAQAEGPGHKADKPSTVSALHVASAFTVEARPMSANLINLRTIQFSDKFALLSQQYGSRLQSLVGQGQYQGKRNIGAALLVGLVLATVRF
jgi:hypothetical protein